MLDGRKRSRRGNPRRKGRQFAIDADRRGKARNKLRGNFMKLKESVKRPARNIRKEGLPRAGADGSHVRLRGGERGRGGSRSRGFGSGDKRMQVQWLSMACRDRSGKPAIGQSIAGRVSLWLPRKRRAAQPRSDMGSIERSPPPCRARRHGFRLLAFRKSGYDVDPTGRIGTSRPGGLSHLPRWTAVSPRPS